MKKLLLLFVTIIISNSVSAQFYEGFENTSGPDPVPSTNWTLGSGNWAVFDNGVGQAERWKINNTVGMPTIQYSGANAAYITRENIGQGNTSEDYLATPAITINTDDVLSFQSRSWTMGDQGTLYQIKIAPASAQQDDPNAYTLVAQFTESELSSNHYVYEAKFVDLSAYAGTTVYIAFVKKYTQSSSSLDGDRWLLDEVTVQEDYDCLINNSCSNYFVISAFIDSNNNGIKDNDELPFQYGNFVYQVNNSGNDIYASSNYGDNYIYNPIYNTSYDFNYAINSDFTPYFTCGTSYTDFTNNTLGTTLYFPVIQTAPFSDARVSLYPWNQPKPGYTYRVGVYLRNTGELVIPNASLTFTKDPNLTISAISAPPSSDPDPVITPTGFTYDFTYWQPNENITIYVDYLVPTLPTVTLGQLVTSSGTIQTANDAVSGNNSSSFSSVIVASYDPNDITESHGNRIVFADFGTNDYLNYTIRFENTGTAAAEFIRVIDALDNKLDESTFELIDASHNVDAIRSGSQLTFNFNHINLPPSTINTDDGHGYVKFRIKPKPGYAIGDIIPNTASIYFDFNPAIVTNTFNTEFVQSLGNDSFENNNVSLYPNPASDFITITNSNEVISSVNLYDISGKKIYSITENMTAEINFNLSGFAKGLYLLELSTENNKKTTKKLIIK
ncbi:T9SS-dependent choice-of-anchor J family protein [Flavobacterium terrisoli]|uniref:T9SS-dependent choice-of-anchor J family protein n=1 Tax=Flavobacterium terrisoli TaxID=3242195 RepID=UPI0025433B3D|nr:T9SS type A sorting domain-containing protein [Flavobacterium buctense]